MKKQKTEARQNDGAGIPSILRVLGATQGAGVGRVVIAWTLGAVRVACPGMA
jgi:hypothetical protein